MDYVYLIFLVLSLLQALLINGEVVEVRQQIPSSDPFSLGASFSSLLSDVDSLISDLGLTPAPLPTEITGNPFTFSGPYPSDLASSWSQFTRTRTSTGTETALPKYTPPSSSTSKTSSRLTVTPLTGGAVAGRGIGEVRQGVDALLSSVACILLEYFMRWL